METENEYYDVSETAVKDHSMLGAHGEELCNNLDVHWMTQTCGSPKDETRKCVRARVCVCVCECVLCVTFTRKGTPSERSLSIGSIGLQYSFILQAVSRIPETRSFFCFWLRPRQKLPKCFTTAESLPRHLWVSIDSTDFRCR